MEMKYDLANSEVIPKNDIVIKFIMIHFINKLYDRNSNFADFSKGNRKFLNPIQLK